MKLRTTTMIFCVGALALGGGCGRGKPGSVSVEDSGDEATEVRVEGVAGTASGATAEDLFASQRILNLAITVAPHRLEALKQNDDSHEYVTCAVREGEKEWDNVGLRCRGDAAKELGSGKPDLVVTFDKFVSKQRFHGQPRVILQSSREDPSYLTAPVAFAMFREANVPALRCIFARVQLNGKPLGLYVVTEGGTERKFLERHFSKTSGNLYDEGTPPDVTGKLEKARGGDRKDQSDVDALAAAALQTDPAERWRQLQQRLDMTRFLNFTALEVLLWQDDSYSIEAKKFRLYHDPASDRMVFFPKAVERVLTKTDGPVMPNCKGIVARAVLTTPEGEQAYRDTLKQLLATVFNPAKVQEQHRELVATLRAAVAGADPEAAKAYDAAVSQFYDTLAKRATFVAQHVNRDTTN
jgi:hypothetical protein